MIPDGDRRQTAQSSRVIDEKNPARMGHHDVVRVFVLHDDIEHEPRRRKRKAHTNHILERTLRMHERFNRAARLVHERDAPFNAEPVFSRGLHPPSLAQIGPMCPVDTLLFMLPTRVHIVGLGGRGSEGLGRKGRITGIRSGTRGRKSWLA